MVSFDTNSRLRHHFGPPLEDTRDARSPRTGKSDGDEASCCFKLAGNFSENDFSPVASRHVIVRQARLTNSTRAF